MVDAVKQVIRKIMRVLARMLNGLSAGHITPNGITVFGLAMHLPITWLVAEQHFYWAAGSLLVFGLFDTLDGELARLQKRASPAGALLDSVTDRYKEVLLYSGAGWAIIAQTGRPYLAVWAVAACGCALLTSYTNAAGDVALSKLDAPKHETNKVFRGGLFPFEIRMFVLFVGLLSGRLTLAIIVIAIGAGITALSRLFRVLDAIKNAERASANA
jgi:phosphatidylglycerophosphate synthase